MQNTHSPLTLWREQLPTDGHRNQHVSWYKTCGYRFSFAHIFFQSYISLQCETGKKSAQIKWRKSGGLAASMINDPLLVDCPTIRWIIKHKHAMTLTYFFILSFLLRQTSLATSRPDDLRVKVSSQIGTKLPPASLISVPFTDILPHTEWRRDDCHRLGKKKYKHNVESFGRFKMNGLLSNKVDCRRSWMLLLGKTAWLL